MFNLKIDFTDFQFRETAFFKSQAASKELISSATSDGAVSKPSSDLLVFINN